MAPQLTDIKFYGVVDHKIEEDLVLSFNSYLTR